MAAAFDPDKSGDACVRVIDCSLSYWFVHLVKTVDPSNLLDNLISHPSSSTVWFSSIGSPSLYAAGLHLSHLLSALGPSRTKSEEQLQCLWRKESHLGGEEGDDKRNKNVSERMRQYGGEITGEKREEKRGTEAGTETSYD